MKISGMVLFNASIWIIRKPTGIICAKGHQPTETLNGDLKSCIGLVILITHKPNKS
jgi:hypothetical protein